MKIKTPRSRDAVSNIVNRFFEGSQGLFSSRCGLDTAYTCRVIAGTRPVTLGFAQQAITVLSEAASKELIQAFMDDLSKAFSEEYSVSTTTIVRKFKKAE